MQKFLKSIKNRTLPLLWGCALVLATSSGCSAPAAELNESTKTAFLQAFDVPPEVAYARELALAECVRKHGATYIPLTWAELNSGTRNNLAGIAGLFTDPETAKTLGYPHAIRDRGQSEAMNPNSEGFEKLSQIIDGKPHEITTTKMDFPDGSTVETISSGCWGEAIRSVYGSVENNLELENIFNVSRMSFTPNVDLANKLSIDEYAKCMQENGYQVSSLQDTMALSNSKFGNSRDPGVPPTPEEAEMAYTDAKCQFETKLLETANAEFLRQTSNWIKENEAWVLEMAELRNQALTNAKKIIEAYGHE